MSYLGSSGLHDKLLIGIAFSSRCHSWVSGVEVSLAFRRIDSMKKENLDVILFSTMKPRGIAPFP